MPLYDYFCESCGEVSEDVILPISEIDTPIMCHGCGEMMKRKCGNAGFQLKGDGWAVDGYDKYIGDINKTRRRDGKPEITYDDIHGTNHLGEK